MIALTEQEKKREKEKYERILRAIRPITPEMIRRLQDKIAEIGQ